MENKLVQPYKNKIEAFLRQANVSLPENPTDYWPAIQSTGVNRLYIISMTGRTGSTWLATCLDQIPGLGFPQEYFTEEGLPHFWTYQQPQNLESVVAGICEKYSESGVFGFKINPGRLFQLGQFVSLSETFHQNHCAWIDMRRLNVIKQAFSFHRARRSGKWHRFKGEVVEKSAQPELSSSELDREIWGEIRGILTQEYHMETYYAKNGIEPTRIYFEELSDSKSQILVRVASSVRGSIDSELIKKVEEKTERLSSSDDEMEELLFVERNAQQINFALSKRSTLNLEAIQNLI